MFEAHPEALLIRSAEGVISEANAAAGDLFRCDVAELIGRRIDHLTSELDVDGLDERLAELEPAESLTLSTTGVRADGPTFPLQLTFTADPGAEEGRAADEATEIFISAHDLSDQRRREGGLSELAELARLDVDAESLTAVAGRAMHLARQLLDAERAAICAIYGPDQKVEWLASHRLEALIAASADLRPDQLPWLTRAQATGRPEVVNRRLPSHERTALSEAADALGIAAFAIVPLRVDEEAAGALGLVWGEEPPDAATNADLLSTIGRLVGLALANARLRSSLLARQRELDESEARYRALFDEAPDALMIATWDGRIVDANHAASQLFGYSRDDLLGRAGEQLWRMTREQRAALLAELRRERRASTTAVGVRADGGRFRQLTSVTVTAFRGEERLLVNARDGGPTSA